VFGLILLAFLVIPLVELYVIIRVADGLGVLETIGLLVVVSIVGAWLVRFQGLGVIRRIQDQLAKGVMPGTELVDGALVVFAGALMLTPGFVTDAAGLLLLLPPTRLPIRTLLVRRFRSRVQTVHVGAPGPFFRTRPDPPSGSAGGVVDVDGHESPDAGPGAGPRLDP
jgi:UPF0716 protein FxsA